MPIPMRKKRRSTEDVQSPLNLVSQVQASQVSQPDGVASNGVSETRSLSSYGDEIDPSAIQYGRDYADWFTARQQSGAGFAPVAQPIATYHEQRDPTTGDYLDMSYGFDFTGVPEPVANVMRLGVPELNRQARGQIPQMNNIRQGVRAQMPVESQRYEQPRIVTRLDPTTGKSAYEIANSTLYRPFFSDPFFSF